MDRGTSQKSDRGAVSARAARAAAIPYKRVATPPAYRFLVVQTSDGNHWTFPKGRRNNKDETLADAAEREAREEAGVTGRLSPAQVTDYVFPRKGRAQTVVAFLLEVADEGIPRKGRDARRRTHWCTRAEIVERLMAGREPAYIETVNRILDAVENALDEEV